MPIYEYQCTQCNDRHEIIQKISDGPLEHCPKCGGAMKKLFSSPAIQFKGSGFYKTDYPSSTSSASSSSAKGEGSGAGSDSKGEAKSSEKSSESTSSAATKAAS